MAVAMDAKPGGGGAVFCGSGGAALPQAVLRSVWLAALPKGGRERGACCCCWEVGVLGGQGF